MVPPLVLNNKDDITKKSVIASPASSTCYIITDVYHHYHDKWIHRISINAFRTFTGRKEKKRLKQCCFQSSCFIGYELFMCWVGVSQMFLMDCE